MKRIVISGASGFLGSNIIKKADLPIVAITRNTEKLKKLNTNIKIIETEVFLSEDFHFTKDDVFINCLFPTNADGFKMGEGLKKVYSCIEKAYDSGIESFINISSQSVYNSKRTVPATEKDSLSLETPYAVGKYSSENLCNYVFKGKRHTNIRMASLIGVNYEQRIINRMVNTALMGNPMKVVGGIQKYGFMDVRDAASGILALVNSKNTEWKEVYNLGTGESCTLKEIVELIKIKLNERGIESYIEYFEGDDKRNSSIDSSEFMKDYLWSPTITVEQTLENIIDSKL